MGIGKRLSRIIKSNVNELLAAAENPEKQLALAVTEMDDALRQAKQNLIQQMAGEKRLQRQLDETDELVKLWSDKAQQAVNAGQDDLAREALRKKRTYEELATEYDRQLYGTLLRQIRSGHDRFAAARWPRHAHSCSTRHLYCVRRRQDRTWWIH